MIRSMATSVITQNFPTQLFGMQPIDSTIHLVFLNDYIAAVHSGGS